MQPTSRSLLSLLLSGLLAAAVSGQCFSVATPTSGNNVVQGVMFDIAVGIFLPANIGSFDQVFGIAGVSDVEIYTKAGTWQGFENNPAAWTLVGSASGVAHSGAPTLTPIPIVVDVTIPAWTTQAFYITVTNQTSLGVAFTPGVNQLGAVIASNAALSVLAGVGKGFPFGGTLGLPTNGCLWNGRVNYCPGFGTTPATNTSLGVGCRQFTTLYEDFDNAVFDLNGTSTRLVPTSGGYAVTNGGAFLPVGSVSAPVTLALGDDTETTVNLTAMGSFPALTGAVSSLTVCSNGFVSTAIGNGVNWFPTVDALRNAPQTIFACWTDYAPNLSGAVRFEESAAVSVVTWDNVRLYGGTGPMHDCTWQIQFHANGEVVFSWSSMFLGGWYLVGYSPGGPSPDPGESDLSTLAANPIFIGASDHPPLRLFATSRPRLGTNWNLTTFQIPPTAVLGAHILGLADPGILDLGFLGLPDCQLRASLDVLTAWLPTGSTHNHSLFVPNSTALLNAHVFTQSAVFQVPPVNAFGAVTSNGMAGRIGDY